MNYPVCNILLLFVLKMNLVQNRLWLLHEILCETLLQFRFSQQCWRRFESSGICGGVTW